MDKSDSSSFSDFSNNSKVFMKLLNDLVNIEGSSLAGMIFDSDGEEEVEEDEEGGDE
jgi:hypothetical protein